MPPKVQACTSASPDPSAAASPHCCSPRSRPRRRSPLTPIGALPKGPVTTITTQRGLFVAVALPHPADKANAWRLARRVDPRVLREVSEADGGANVVVVYKVTGTGSASIVYALTRGDASSKALGAITPGSPCGADQEVPARGRSSAPAAGSPGRRATAARPRD